MERRGERGAFTLIELLVVTSIIAILMSLVGMMVAGAKSDAKKATCAFNLRQTSIGINTYLQDFDDVYPQTKKFHTEQPQIDDADGHLEDPDRGSLLTALRSYSTGVETCPSDPDKDDDACSSVPTARATNSYLVNSYFVWGLSQTQITNGVGSTILLGERHNSIFPDGSGPNCDNTYHPWFNPSNPLAPRNDMDELNGALDTSRHQGGANYLFADGHCQWYKWGSTYNAERNLHLPY